MNRYFILILILLLCAGCISRKEMLIEEDVYHNEEFGFKIDIPDQWRAVIVPEEESVRSDIMINMKDPDNESTIVFSATSSYIGSKEAVLLDIERFRYSRNKKFELIGKGVWSGELYKGYYLENSINMVGVKIYQYRIYIKTPDQINLFVLSSSSKDIADIYKPIFFDFLNSFVDK